jgi:radical SAM superfamily enzyme YgiQ (UPF0313 family)
MEQINHILLVNPVNKKKGFSSSLFTKMPPLSICVLAALTPAAIKLSFIDESFDDFDEKIASMHGINLVGITAFTSTVTRAYEIASFFRSKGIPVIMGGIHVSFMYEEALRYCDSVVVGDAEGIWDQVLQDAGNKALKKIYKNDINSDGWKKVKVNYDILNPKYQWGALRTTKGCPMDCEFCTVTSFNGRIYQRRAIEDVINDIKRIQQKQIFFYDDNLVGRTTEQKQWAIELFKRMVKEDMRKPWFCQGSINVAEDPDVLDWMYKAGCRMILIGFESVDRQNLVKMNKKQNIPVLDSYPRLIRNIHQKGIAVLCSLMVGYPFDNLETAQKIVRFVHDNWIDVVQVTHLTPFPGTKVYERLKREGNLTKCNYPEDWKHYTFSRITYKHENLSEQELLQIVDLIKDELSRSFFTLILRGTKTILSTKSITSALFAFKWNYGLRTAYLGGIKRKQQELIELNQQLHDAVN